jgi:hypothetical protein
MDSPTFQSRKKDRSGHNSRLSSSRKASIIALTMVSLPLFLCVWIWFVILTQGQLTIGGVPAPIVVNFVQDETARNAYFDGDKQKLHDRLQEMGVEEQIKAFYRPQFNGDEVKLDQHIHQLLYNRTGYVGKAYRVNRHGVLVLRRF